MLINGNNLDTDAGVKLIKLNSVAIFSNEK